MERLNTKNYTNPDSTTALDSSKNIFGGITNFQKVLANSPNALNGVGELFKQMFSGQLDPEIRTKVALAISESNSCEYCLAVYTDAGNKLGLDATEMINARRGEDKNLKTEQAVKFALTVLNHQGDVTDSEIDRVKDAGFSDAEIVEILVLVGLFSIGNYIGKVSEIELDIPKVSPLNKVA